MFVNKETYKGDNYKIASLIQRRRLQMLIHSRAYYELDTNMISDKQFDKWARELVSLQNDYPEIASTICFAEDFKDWDGNTGAFLNLKQPWVISKTNQIIHLAKGDTNEHKKVQQKPRKSSSQKPKGKATTKQRRNSLF